jgi:CO/xanthine dehydrogenase FAD-binding subunit
MVQNLSLTIGRQPAQFSQATRRSQRGPRPLADGHSLIPTMKLRLATLVHLIGPHGILELKGISRCVVIGAMVTQHELQASEVIAVSLPILDVGREAC